jgi:hypothetical protein
MSKGHAKCKWAPDKETGDPVNGNRPVRFCSTDQEVTRPHCGDARGAVAWLH